MARTTASPTRSGGMVPIGTERPSMYGSSRPNIPTRLTKPGQIAEKPTGSSASSARSACVNPTTPCLVAA